MSRVENVKSNTGVALIELIFVFNILDTEVVFNANFECTFDAAVSVAVAVTNSDVVSLPTNIDQLDIVGR